MEIKIQCTKCKELKGASNDRVIALVKKAGSYEELVASYLCKTCRKNEAPASMESSIKKLLQIKGLPFKKEDQLITPEDRMEIKARLEAAGRRWNDKEQLLKQH